MEKTFGLPRVWLYAGLVLTLLLLIPIWYFQYLPLNDWPNPMASMHLLIQQQAGQQTYILPNPNPLLPNALAFWFIEALGPLIGVEMAGRALLSLILMLTIWGSAYFFGSVDRRLGPLGLSLGALLAYNWFFLMGFLNYALGVPLFLIAAGYWLEKGRKNEKGARPSVRRTLFELAVMFVLSALAALSHLIAGAMLLGLVGFWRLAQALGALRKKPKIESIIGAWKPALALDLAAALPVLALGALSASTLLAGESDQSLTVWGPAARKLLYAILEAPSPVLLMAGGLVLVSYLAIWILQYRRDWRPQAGWLLLAILMAGGAMLLPESTASWQFAAPRLWPFFYYFIAMAIFLPLVHTPEGEGMVKEIAVGLLLMALLQAGSLAKDWNSAQESMQQIGAVSADLARGSVVLPIGEGFAETGTQAGVSPYFHAWGYWVMEKDVFSPYLFVWNYSPISLKGIDAHGAAAVSGWLQRIAYKNFAKPTNDSCLYWREYYEQDFNWSLVAQEYDYVVMRKGACDDERAVPWPFEKIAQHGSVYVFENREKNSS
ncbi:MAG: hypothetical protein M1530_03765 [Candidatus Marsarchaeota archaeon]|nr:hypothetical protein [Candidatus Marsarchaeota archaeon]